MKKPGWSVLFLSENIRSAPLASWEPLLDRRERWRTVCWHFTLEEYLTIHFRSSDSSRGVQWTAEWISSLSHWYHWALLWAVFLYHPEAGLRVNRRKKSYFKKIDLLQNWMLKIKEICVILKSHQNCIATQSYVHRSDTLEISESRVLTTHKNSTLWSRLQRQIDEDSNPSHTTSWLCGPGCAT